jgi:hypothetical protein
MGQVEQALPEAPGGLDQTFPRGGVNGAGDWKPARTLKRLNESDGAVAKDF